MIGIDLFSGAGGLSLGAEMAGIEVVTAIEFDSFAAKTYQINHPKTTMINDDIRNVRNLFIDRKDSSLVLFGGPPCQGFSTSNQKTRNNNNPQNWLYKEFIRLAEMIKSEWIVFENVKGIKETENGYFVNEITHSLSKLGYTCTSMILCASNYGVPQIRLRFFLIGSLHGKRVNPPCVCSSLVTVKEAISDLPSVLSH